MKEITASELRENGVCEPKIKTFVGAFGDRMEITFNNVWKFLEARLYLSWMERLLAASAKKEYQKCIATAWKEYLKVSHAALEEFENLCAQGDFENVVEPAREEFEKIIYRASEEYMKAKTAALVKALREEYTP